MFFSILNSLGFINKFERIFLYTVLRQMKMKFKYDSDDCPEFDPIFVIVDEYHFMEKCKNCGGIDSSDINDECERILAQCTMKKI